MSSNVTHGAEMLRVFLKAHGIKPTSAARSIGVSHVSMLAYLSGTKRPDGDRRDAIERFTDGAVPRSAWRTEDEQVSLDAVKPATSTGTDG